MPLVIFEAGAILVMARYIEQKTTNGVWYFRRRVPRDVQRHYPKLNKRGELYFSLETKDRSEAAKAAHRNGNSFQFEPRLRWQKQRPRALSLAGLGIKPIGVTKKSSVEPRKGLIESQT